MKPVISVITPVYNAERFIAETIESVRSQTFTNWELILVDDASTDKSSEILQKYRQMDSRIRSVRLPSNQGAARARNRALKEARGRFLAFLDSDDLWTPEKLERQLDFMHQNGYAFTYTAYTMIDITGQDEGMIVSVPGHMNYYDLLKNTTIGCLTVMIDSCQTGNFTMPDVRAGQDTAAWLQLLRKGITAYGLNEPLAKYRQVPGSISSNKWNAVKRTWNTYRNLEKLSLPAAAYYMAHYVANAIKRRM